MIPYSPGKPIEEVQRELGLARVIKLASNENPLGPSPKAVKAIQEAASRINLYPDGSSHRLKQAISEKFDVATSQVLVGSGSEEIIQHLGLIFLGDPSDEVIAARPSFPRYGAAAHVADCRLIEVPLDRDLRHDLPAMAKAITSRTKLLFVCNPNNPTGTVLRKSEFESFLADVPDEVCLVLDEAYFELAQDAPEPVDSLDYLRARRNVVGLRTLSKISGLAGVRIGYGFAPEYVVDAVQRVRLPFHANSLAQVGAIVALSDEEHIRKTIENNRVGLEAISAALAAEGARVIPSYTNFAYADLHRPARPVFEALLRKGVIVRPGDVFGDPTFLRVSVGTSEENAAFAEAFKKVMRQPVGA